MYIEETASYSYNLDGGRGATQEGYGYAEPGTLGFLGLGTLIKKGVGFVAGKIGGSRGGSKQDLANQAAIDRALQKQETAGLKDKVADLVDRLNRQYLRPPPTPIIMPGQQPPLIPIPRTPIAAPGATGGLLSSPALPIAIGAGALLLLAARR